MSNSILKRYFLLSHVKSGRFLLLGFCLAFGGCNTADQNTQKSVGNGHGNLEFAPIRSAKEDATAVEKYEAADFQAKTQYSSGPGVSITRQVADAQAKELNLNLTGAPISANYHDMPLPMFINEVFGEQLGLSFNLDPQIQKQTDFVTLRITEQIPPAELFKVASRTLAAYGVSVTQEDKVLQFTIDKNASAGEVPLLVSGRALPEVPESHRPVFLFVPLKAVSGSKITSWVKDALNGKEIQIQEDAMRNSVLLKGKPDVVAQAVQIIEVLDQPIMRGKFSTSIEPAFVKVGDLSKNLKEVLNAEGYDAQIKSPTGSIIIIPLDGTNQMVVFAASQAVLDHVRDWVNQLDRRQQMSIDQGIFTYEVRNTDASHIVDILGGLDSGTQTTSSTASTPKKSGASAAISDTTSTGVQSQAATSSGKLGNGSFVVDQNRNTIIYKGSGQSWADLLPVIQSLDKSVPSVLVEVLVAEVSLTDKENSGVEFVANGSATNNGNKYTSSVKTLGGLGVGSVGLTGTLNSAGETRAILNFFQQNQRAEIRSRPRVMVKSGQAATIDVGKQVPTRGAATVSGSASSYVVQSISSQKTGISLTVKPIVHTSGNVDIDIQQQLSEATQNDTSNIDSPIIFNREIKTVVTLKDGGSILIGGLISSNKSRTKSQVPKLGSIPLFGKLFNNDKDSIDRTELMVMIIPYVIDSPAEGQAITKTIQDAFQRAE